MHLRTFGEKIIPIPGLINHQNKYTTWTIIYNIFVHYFVQNKLRLCQNGRFIDLPNIDFEI